MKLPSDVDFLCVDHFDEALYKQALKWVGSERRAAFISEVPRISENSRVKIYHLESPLSKQKIAKQIAWSSVFQRIHMVGEEFREDIEKYHLGAHLTLSEAAGYWIKPMENARANCGVFKRGKELQNVFQNIPAIIVGAGPSLEKNQNVLKELRERALIFAGGTALSAMNIEPHFAAITDPEVPKRERQFPNVPFFYQARMDSEIFSKMKSDKILFPDSSVDAINWLYEEEEKFDGGWTVGNFLTQIAIFLGCSPIVFIGMDFAYENGKKYSGVEAEAEVELIEVGGKLTQRDWLMAALWTQEKAKDRDFYSLSEGILGLRRFERTLPKQNHLEQKVNDAILSLKSETPNRFQEWDASLKRCKTMNEYLDSEIIYQMLLEPLWQIWKPIFEREVEIDPNQEIEQHMHLFFQNVLSEYE